MCNNGTIQTGSETEYLYVFFFQNKVSGRGGTLSLLGRFSWEHKLAAKYSEAAEQ